MQNGGFGGLIPCNQSVADGVCGKSGSEVKQN